MSGHRQWPLQGVVAPRFLEADVTQGLAWDLGKGVRMETLGHGASPACRKG